MGAQQYAIDYNGTLNSTSFAMESDTGAFAPFGLSFSGSANALAQLQVLSSLVSPLYAGNVSAGIIDVDVGFLSEYGVPSAGFWALDPRFPSTDLANYTNNFCTPFAGGNPPLPASLEVTPGYLWYHHTAADTIDKLDPLQLQQDAAAMAIWATSVANLPALLPRQ